MTREIELDGEGSGDPQGPSCAIDNLQIQKPNVLVLVVIRVQRLEDWKTEGRGSCQETFPQ